MLAEKIRILIYNREYEIDAGGLTPLEASALAQYVTDKMKELERQTKIVDTSRLAVLAALNITDELFRVKASRSHVSGSMDKKADDNAPQVDGKDVVQYVFKVKGQACNNAMIAEGLLMNVTEALSEYRHILAGQHASTLKNVPADVRNACDMA